MNIIVLSVPWALLHNESRRAWPRIEKLLLTMACSWLRG